jgi:hypothetical protein
MLEKIPGHPLLHKLRLIHLFEADLNLSLCVLRGHRPIVSQGERFVAFGDK